ncbi:leucine--tRNA ligase [Candidatus Magnetaquicoccus inordinatus]|uniref:leucine--tRNA ligase n=1 Tax=Candidatus Magnetaquicoccus inordinatus TaxID=2496818 RepID=UPI00102B1BD2|nr:leucine--tRNA ligase [Candidatus Magnetaquicoccus inordinatus]
MNERDRSRDKYNPQAIEKKWQTYWEQQQSFRAVEEPQREKYYLLVMFPYPSGRIHMGHVRNYTIGDLLARYQRLRGKNVLHPMGWDAFGMPAENAAIQKKTHPRTWTYNNIDTMRQELRSMGLSYDWQRELATCDPHYAHWEQELFLKLYERGLVYRKLSQVNWDPVDQTVLANEQVIDGKGWRSGAVVERRELSQWFLKITAYAEELLSGLQQLEEGWPETVRSMQTHWIGKSHGLEFSFAIADSTESLPVYTTRPDTVMGITFCSIAAEHPLARQVAAHNPAAQQFIQECQSAGTSEEAVERLEKKGFATGLFAIHPLTGEKVPIFIANFVLMNYGTGAVMAVPAHDQRDFEFARTYQLPIRIVIQPEGTLLDPQEMSAAYTGPGTLCNSGPFDGLDNETAKQKIIAAFVADNLGKATTQYRLRDWGISRQRYWGNPIPMIHCPHCGIVAVPSSQLPVPLPDDVELTGSGNPLARHPTWKHTHCPNCGQAAERETDTMDTFAESSWYFLRYCCPDYAGPLDVHAVNYWMPVDQYVGGIEHAVLHLLYARFFHKALRDCGFVSCDEPFSRLLTQGMVRKDTLRCPEHGWRYPEEVRQEADGLHCQICAAPVQVGRNEKMSKSKHNVVDPNEIIQGYGADTARLFMLFAAPPEQDLEWNDNGVDGAWRFLNRLWRLIMEIVDLPAQPPARSMPEEAELRALRSKTHLTIDKVNRDVQRFQFNTAISAVMELVNAANELLHGKADAERSPSELAVLREVAESAVLLLNPFVPHITEELWQQLGHAQPLCLQRWPEADPEALQRESITLVVQINGKLRARLTVAADASQKSIEEAALAEPTIQQQLQNRSIHKRIFVPGRLLNLVVQ